MECFLPQFRRISKLSSIIKFGKFCIWILKESPGVFRIAISNEGAHPCRHTFIHSGENVLTAFSRICKRANWNYLCAFWGWSRLIEFSITSLEQTHTYKTEHFNSFEVVQKTGVDVVLTSLVDGSVRSYAITPQNTLQALAQLTMTHPRNLLWSHHYILMLVSDREFSLSADRELSASSKVDNVRVVTVESGGRALKVTSTPIASKLGMTIDSWCFINENTLLCFSEEKTGTELVEFKMK